MTLRERIRENLHRLPLKWRVVVVVSAVGLAIAGAGLLIGAGRNLIGRLRFDARVARAEAARVEADQRAETARKREEEAIAARAEIEARLAAAEVRAAVAEAALDGARQVTVRVRQDYDQNRNRDLSVVSADVIELCARLAQLNYSCRPTAPVR